FVLYSNYDPATHTHQRIIYNDGELIVSGNGVLAGDWSEHTLVDWAKVKDSCTSLTFAPDCGITEIGDYAFASMSQLTNELKLPETVTKIGNYAFFHCGVTGELRIGTNGVYKEISSVGAYAFYGSNLSKIDLSSLDLNNFEWGINAFKGCVGSEMLILPANAVSTQIISDFGFSYYYENDNGVEKVTVNTGSANVSELTGESYKIEAGSKIYCRTLEESKLESDKFNFVFLITVDDTTVVAGEEKYYTNYKDGLIKVDPITGFVEISDMCSPMHFTISAYHQNADGTPAYDIVHYYMDFEVTENLTDFAGGQGTKDRPYLIKTSTQFKSIAKQPNKYYKLLNDIDFKGETISPLGTLTGKLDGNGYAVYGFKIDVNATQAGLFNSISNSAEVRNLTIGHDSKKYFDGKSVYISSSNNDTTDGSRYCGIIAGINNGIIENCFILNTKVNLYHYWHGDNTLYGYAGGIVGQNNKTINNCDVSNNEIRGEVKTKKDTDPSKCYVYVGGIVCYNTANGSIES
ncbi:MAG: leucine-rich repeat domain-containing protein, partial [Clostridia bacterium]|nr:leucine-rich repeat domain-containing protein [Clostridia bacterium]